MRNELLLGVALALDIGIAHAQPVSPSYGPGPAPIASDNGSSTTLANGVLSVATTFSNTETFNANVHLNANASLYLAAGLFENVTANSGSTSGTMPTSGGVVLDSSSAATGAWKATATNGRVACWANETSTAKTITSTTGSFVLGTAPSATITLSAYGHMCAVYDNTSGLWAATNG